jgi:hypothetical protein
MSFLHSDSNVRASFAPSACSVMMRPREVDHTMPFGLVPLENVRASAQPGSARASGLKRSIVPPFAEKKTDKKNKEKYKRSFRYSFMF